MLDLRLLRLRLSGELDTCPFYCPHNLPSKTVDRIIGLIKTEPFELGWTNFPLYFFSTLVPRADGPAESPRLKS